MFFYVLCTGYVFFLMNGAVTSGNHGFDTAAVVDVKAIENGIC